MTNRICMIGTSLIGAVLRAYRGAAPRSGFDLSFFGYGDPKIDRVEIRDGTICNMPFISDKASCAVADYHGFVIYADMRTPHEMVRTEQHLRQNGFSRQVGDATLFDMVSATFSYRLRQALREITDAPVYFLSRNVPRPTPPLKMEAQYLRGVEVLRMLVDPERYIEFPRALFGEAYAPNPDYYRGSVDVWGNDVASDDDPYHDDTHLNEAGGKLVLDQILRCLEADLFIA